MITMFLNGMGRLRFDGGFAISEKLQNVFAGFYPCAGSAAFLRELPELPRPVYELRQYVPHYILYDSLIAEIGGAHTQLDAKIYIVKR